MPRPSTDPPLRRKDTYTDFLVEQFAPLGGISVRSMFGGKTLYCDGVVFALVADSVLYLKADEINRPMFDAQALPAFRPFPDQTAVMQYYRAPAEMFDDPEEIRRWAGGAVEAGRRAQARKKPRGAKSARATRK